MSFKLWDLIRKNDDLYNTCKDIQENLLDDYFNFDDSSVGIHSIGSLDENFVKEFNKDDFEGCEITSWKENVFILQVDSNKKNKKYLLVIKLIGDWEIINAIVKRTYND